MVAMEICGSSQRKNGTRKREVCSAESTPVEPMKITPSQVSKGNQYLRNDLSLVFNEAVSVWESFPFTTGEKLPRRKGGPAPNAFGATFSIEVAAAKTARSTSTNQSQPASAFAMGYGVAGGCRYIPKIVACLNLISPVPSPSSLSLWNECGAAGDLNRSSGRNCRQTRASANHGKSSIAKKRKVSCATERCAEKLCTNFGPKIDRKFSARCRTVRGFRYS